MINDRPLQDTDAGLPPLSLDSLTPAQWGRVGAGAALAVAGSGLMSIGTLIRLAAMVGGGAMVYQTLKSTRLASELDGEPAPASRPLAPVSSWAARPARANPVVDPDANGATMEGSDPSLTGGVR